MSVVTRQRAFREGHPTLAVGDTCWYVPEVRPHWYGTVAVPVRVLGGGRPCGVLHAPEVSVVLLADAPAVDGADARPAGLVVSVLDREVGPDALREHVTIPVRPGERYRIPPQWALGLFCPVHGFIHGEPSELCAGEPQPAPPLPGDAVRLASSKWDSLVQAGDFGVLGGLVGKPITRGAGITFNARTFRDDHVVSCGGGPGTIETPVEELTRTDETVTIWVWEWRDGLARAHNGIDYTVAVPVWDWHPTAPGR